MNTWTVIRNCCQGGPACSESDHPNGKRIRVVHAVCLSESRATEIAERWGAYHAVALNKSWTVGHVTRANAGASLFAPVIIEDNEYVEHGITPSHDASTVQRSVDLLNRGEKI